MLLSCRSLRRTDMSVPIELSIGFPRMAVVPHFFLFSSGPPDCRVIRNTDEEVEKLAAKNLLRNKGSGRERKLKGCLKRHWMQERYPSRLCRDCQRLRGR